MKGDNIMTGKVLKVASNDLYGNSEDRNVRVYGCFEHSKYMNNYIVFSVEGNNKLCYGSVHLKDKSLVIFAVKSEIKKYVLEFLDEYVNDRLENFKMIDINNIDKVELVSFNEMEYDNIKLLDEKSIKIEVKQEEVVESKPILGYLLVVVLVLFALGITLLYFKPELFIIKYKGLECKNNMYDEKIGLRYDIDKEIRFDKDDVVESISVVQTYIFLDSNSYYKFKEENSNNIYFNNGERYKYVDEELKFKLFYEEESVIDSYNEMLSYMKREGFSCIEREYEE